GNGIFSSLTTTLLEREKADGLFVFNTPNKSSKPGYLKMGWKEVTRLPLWVRPIMTFSIASDLLQRRPVFLLNSEKPETLEECFQKDSVAECATNSNADARFHTPRTLAYLGWRYKDIPAFSYDVRWSVTSGGSALIVFRKKI